jgi:hypothetical protein
VVLVAEDEVALGVGVSGDSIGRGSAREREGEETECCISSRWPGAALPPVICLRRNALIRAKVDVWRRASFRLTDTHGMPE